MNTDEETRYNLAHLQTVASSMAQQVAGTYEAEQQANMTSVTDEESQINDTNSEKDAAKGSNSYAVNSFSSAAGSQPQAYNPDGQNTAKPAVTQPEENEENVPISPTKTRLYSPKLASQRKKITVKFIISNLLLAGVCLSILSLYWGSLYQTTKHLERISIIAIIQDDYIPPNDLNLTSVVAPVPSFIEQSTGKWHVYNQSYFQEKFNVQDPTMINERLNALIHDEKYWIALNIGANLTMRIVNSLTTPNEPFFNSTQHIRVVYETSREPTTLEAYMLPIIQEIELAYQDFYHTEYLPELLSKLQNSTTTPLSNTGAANLANIGKFQFDYDDILVFPDRILIAPLQVGLIYCLILTVFQLSLFGPLHAEMAKYLKPKHIIIYRLSVSWATYFFLSLFFCTVSAIFQIDFTVTFGKGGFVIYWMTTYLVMLALGGANENVLSLIILFIPEYLPLWLLSWIIMNISPTFNPMVLDNVFYRYGYMMPLHQALDIFKVVFLNVSKRHMGRNYGILVAWIVVNTCLFPLVMKIVGKTVQKRMEAKKN
ncbi:hypothetical protein NCAS_0A07190 [Naumovozyma castellii]|uniref:DUF3533 domain-containing protein n=1 Tax=Naumovozyma castellii TaxID=27288 RepID=G0V729_NAUCA|nr:hypothetical protein NCAS_0A07190 [Naumovozyma castellii CBS 4309]CCC67277.1 hypothetical protein NCAS_0A07190 [Naumovozyma castellii CBS 4309]